VNLIRLEDYANICAAIEASHSLVVVEPEANFCAELPDRLQADFASQLLFASAVYRGSVKWFLVDLADALGLATTDEKEKTLSVDALKQAIADLTANESVLLVFPQAKRLPASVRYWLESMIESVILVLIVVVNPSKDLFLSMTEIEVSLPTETEIRNLFRVRSKQYGLNLKSAEISALLPIVGRSPIALEQVLKQRKLGVKKIAPIHKQYVNVTPLWLAFLAGFAALRFVGQGTGRKDLQIFGGLALMTFMGLRQLGQIRGDRRKLGQ